MSAAAPLPLTPLLNLSDPEIANIPVIDCGEALVSLRDLHPRLLLDGSEANVVCIGHSPIFVARETVARRLVEAAAALPPGYLLLVKESLRPAALQKLYFERRLERVMSEQPSLAEHEAIARTAQFVAPPWVAGHPSGGAVDVTLSDGHGAELDLGCGYDEDEAASEGACFSDFPGLGPAARANRALLFAAMNGIGFVNYPFEWWHWSYGDRYWAVAKRQPHAIYGTVDTGH